jgi:hypothetical protein
MRILKKLSWPFLCMMAYSGIEHHKGLSFPMETRTPLFRLMAMEIPLSLHIRIGSKVSQILGFNPIWTTFRSLNDRKSPLVANRQSASDVIIANNDARMDDSCSVKTLMPQAQ